MPSQNKTAERRAIAAWNARACAAAISAGAQVFLFGTGIAMPLCLSSAWIASLAALPAAAIIVIACHRAMRRRPAGKPFSRPAATLFSLAFFLSALFSTASLISLAEQTLLPQARTLLSAAVTALFLLLAALSAGTGAGRLCYALRFALPSALFALAAVSLPLPGIDGLFPLLGAGKTPLLAASLCMPAAAVPAMIILLPPPEIPDPLRSETALPGTGFFLCRILAGMGAGALLVTLLCAGSTYASIAGMDVWGERLRIASSAKPHEGFAQALLLLCQTCAVFLSSVSLLLSACESLCAAFPLHPRIALCALCALLFALLVLLTLFGFSAALFAAPLAILPAAAALILHRRQEKTI